MVSALLSRRLPRILGTALLAALVLAAFVSHRHEVDTALRILQQARHMPVFAAVACQLVFFALTVALHASAFRAVDAPIGWRHLLPVWFTSLFVNLAVPGTGSSAFLADASRRGIAPARAAARWHCPVAPRGKLLRC